MNKFFFRIAMLFGAVALLASCEDAVSEEAEVRDEANLVSSNVLVNPTSGSTGTISGTSTAAWSAEAEVNDWFTISPESGSAGDFEITVTTTKENPTTDAIYSKVTIYVGSSAVPVTITQMGEEITITPSTTAMSYDADGTTADGTPTVDANAAWVASPDVDWITINEASGEIGTSETLAFTVAGNISTVERVGYVYLGVEGNTKMSSIEITQEGADLINTFDVSNIEGKELSGSGATPTFTITANTSWEITSTYDWLSFSPESGVASADAVTVTMTVNPNEDKENSRSGSFSIVLPSYTNDGLTVNFTQAEGAIPEDVTALAALAATLNGTTSVIDWSNEGDYKTWTGTEWNAAGNLTKLDLNGLGIDGTIPEGLSAFTALAYLDLSDNNLTGEVPASFEDLVNMSTFKVNNNLLSGTFNADIINNPQFLNWDAMNNIYPQQGEESGDTATAAQLRAWTYKPNLVGVLRITYWQCGGPNWTAQADFTNGQKDGTSGLSLSDFYVYNDVTGIDEPDWLRSYTDGFTATYYGVLAYTNSGGGQSQRFGCMGANNNYMNNMSGVIPSEVATLSGIAQIRLSNSGIEGIDPRALTNAKYLNFVSCTIEQDFEEMLLECTDGYLVEIYAGSTGLYCSNGITEDMAKKWNTANAITKYVITGNTNMKGDVSTMFDYFSIYPTDSEKETFVTGTSLTY